MLFFGYDVLHLVVMMFMWVRYNESWYGEGAAGGTVISLKCCSSSERTTPDSSGGDKHST